MSKKKKKEKTENKNNDSFLLEDVNPKIELESTDVDPLDLLFKQSDVLGLDYVEGLDADLKALSSTSDQELNSSSHVEDKEEGDDDLSVLSNELTGFLTESDILDIEENAKNSENENDLEPEVSVFNLSESEENTSEEMSSNMGDELFLTSESDSPIEQMQITDDIAISILESLLFISDRPVGLTTFKNAFENTNITTKKIKELLNELKIDFVNSRRGVSLEEIDGAYQLRTKPDNQDFIKKILKPKIFKLTGPSLETLSVIAYKQPCVKSQVDEVRGVESGHLIRALMDKGLVAFDGKSELPGRPMQYKTTKKFLEIFGLRNLSELPSLSEIEELLPEGIGEDEDKQTLSELAGKLEESFEATSYSIGEEELGKITEQLSGISTETEFFEIEKQKQRESRDRDRAEGIREALILGDAVDPKDEKWLQRYDLKMNSTAPVLEDLESTEANTNSDYIVTEITADDLDLEDELSAESNIEEDLEVEQQTSQKSKDQEDLESLVQEDPLDLI